MSIRKRVGLPGDDVPAEQERPIDPRVLELLVSANADHLLEGGTGDYDTIIELLQQKKADPANAGLIDQIDEAIKILEFKKLIDPIRVDTRKRLRDFFQGAIGKDPLEPRGPMELE